MNNIISALAQLLLLVYSSGAVASSLPPIQLDFNPDDFSPNVGQVPDSALNAPSDALLQSNNGVAGVVPERDYVDEFAPKASKITVTGTVKKWGIPILSGRGPINLLQQASGIEVQFWQADKPNDIYRATTDDLGNYQIELSNGFWQGEACGAAQGYNPNAWQINVKNNRLVNLQAVAYSKPTITKQSLDVVMQGFDIELYGTSTFVKRAGEEIRINGSGFGCNGTLVFEFQNAVDQCGSKQDPVYNHAPIKIKYEDFISSTDNQLVLNMPNLRDSIASTTSASLRIAKMYYQKGSLRSNAIFVTQFIQDPLVTSVCDGTYTAAANAKSNQASTGSMRNLVEGVAPSPERGGRRTSSATQGGGLTNPVAQGGGLTQSFGTIVTQSQIATGKVSNSNIKMNHVSQRLGRF